MPSTTATTPRRAVQRFRWPAGTWALALAVGAGCGPLAANAAAQARPAIRQPFTPPVFPAELRRAVPLGAGPSAPLAADGRRVFVPLRSGALAAVDVDAGETAWRVPLAVTRPPVLAGGHLLVGTVDTLEALSPATGESLWRVPLAAAIVAGPLLSGDLAIVVLAGGEVVAVVAADGASRWKTSLEGAPAGVGAADGDALYLALADGRIVSLRAADGARRWEQRVGGGPTGLTVAQARLYVGSLDNFFYALDASTGRIRWRWRTGGDITGAAVTDASRVYFSSLDNLLRALDRHTGVQRWKRPLAARPVVGPLLVGSTLVLAGLSPELQAAWTDSGKPAGRYGLDADPGTGPLMVPGWWVGEDLLCVATAEGSLVLLGRRLSPSVAVPVALPGVPVPVTVTPPQ